MLLEGRTIVLTGASGGIGRRLAMGLAREGADLALHYYRAEPVADGLVEVLQSMGRRVLAIQADLRDAQQANAVVERTVESLGQCDVLVNNAGAARRVPFLDLTPELWRETFAVNVESTFFCTLAAARQMVRQKKGKIINMGSIVAELATVSLVPYCAAKAAIHMFTKAAAVALAPHGVTVNAVAPGVVLTERMQQRLEDPRNRDPIMARTPTGALVAPEDLVGTVVFLASSLSDHLTGQIITVDHGYSLEGLEWQLES